MESENCRRLKDIYPQVYHFYFTEQQQPEWTVVHHHSINSPQIVRRKERNPVPICALRVESNIDDHYANYLDDRGRSCSLSSHRDP